MKKESGGGFFLDSGIDDHLPGIGLIGGVGKIADMVRIWEASGPLISLGS